MKKNLFILAFCLLTASASSSYAQFKLGFKTALGFAFNRTDSKTAGQKFESGPATARIIIGAIADIQFAEKYAFSTGLLYTSKQCNFTQTGPITSNTGVAGTNSGSETWGTQYLQIPLTMKLFTSEIFPNAKVYIQAGPQIEIMVGKKNKTSTFSGTRTIVNTPPTPNATIDEPTLVKNFNVVDISVTASSGIEYTIGENILFGGINFQTGFLNNVWQTNNVYQAGGKEVAFSSKTSMFSIEIGIKL